MNLTRFLSTIAAIVVCTGFTANEARAAERRCGWFMNPTPGNLLLSDRDGQWWITSQMQALGPDAAGADANSPPFDDRQFVRTQPSGRGYGCACLGVETDAASKRITKVISGQIRPLAQCRADSSLPKPDM